MHDPTGTQNANRGADLGGVGVRHDGTNSMTLAADLIRYLGTLTLSGGDHDGQAFVVLPWERRFVRGAFAAMGPAALSLGRGNGKTALVAGIATAVVDPAGPLHGRRREAVCVASAFNQGKIIYEDVQAFLAARYDLADRKTWRIQDSQNVATIEYRRTGARVRCVGSDPKRAHGLRPALALLDEPAQWEPARRDGMLAAIKTGMGKVPGSRMIALGTRPAAPEHWFSRMLAGGATSYAQSHAARPGDPPFQMRTWKRANPSLDHLPSLLAEIREEAEAAKTDPAMLASFKALRLNAGTADTMQSVLLTAGVWEGVEGDAEAAGKPVWGLDLGTSAAMSAVAAFWPSTGALRCLAAFPNEPSLGERGLADGVGALYQRCAERDELIRVGGAAVDIGELLQAALDRFGPPSALAADRWREAELRDALKKAGVPMAALSLRGQGYKDGGEDVRTFRRAVAEGRVVPVRSLLLRSAMGEARCVVDAAGNSKLCKGTEGGRRLRARDDSAAAAVLAVSVGCRRAERPTRGWTYGGMAG